MRILARLGLLAALAFASLTQPVLYASVGDPAQDRAADPASGVGKVNEQLRAVSARDVRLTDPFWNARLDALRQRTLNELLSACDESGRTANFLVAAGLAEGRHQGGPGADADVYRVVEAVAAALLTEEDTDLLVRAAAIVEQISEAPGEDGYLDTWTSLSRKNPWDDLRRGHELLNAAHLLRAACAWERATGDGSLLQVAVGLADHLLERFGPEDRVDPPGRPGIEAALVELSQVTDEPRYLELARFFLEQRGDEERSRLYGELLLDDIPLLGRKRALGDAQVGLRLFEGLAAVACETGEQDYLVTAQTLYYDVVLRKAYATGGVGQGRENRFGEPFSLPLNEANCTTRASLAYARWAHQMFLLNRHPTYVDGIERQLFNNLLAAGSADGSRIFLSNPLTSARGAVRAPVAKVLGTAAELTGWLLGLAGYVYAHDDDDLYVLLTVASETEVELGGTRVRIRQKTDFPRSGKMELRIEPAQRAKFTVHVRVPGWCEEELTVGVNDALTIQQVEHGTDRGLWLTFQREWKKGDVLRLELPLVPKRIRSDRRTRLRDGLVAISRGPLIYAFESADNGPDLGSLVLLERATLKDSKELDPGLGVPRVTALGRARVGGRQTAATLVAVPYASWATRERGPMRVWIRAR
ncbi:MAG: beta-L-arabinofuranosidase domain-containing protein [Planctomycetota bacterium]